MYLGYIFMDFCDLKKNTTEQWQNHQEKNLSLNIVKKTLNKQNEQEFISVP